MTGVLLDTHAWVWSFADETLLSPPAHAAIAAADAVHVSPISLFEIGQKVRLGKWPEMEPLAPSLADVLVQQGGIVAPMTADICLRAALSPWAHRDPFDRLIAATAELLGLTLVSKDAAFASLPSIRCIW